MSSRKILITGATGLIGQALVTELLGDENYQLRLAVRDPISARAQLAKSDNLHKVEFIECDLAKLTEYKCNQLVKDCQFVIHLAGLVHKPEAPYEEYELYNVRATEQLASASLANSIDTFLFMSSVAVYGDDSSRTVDEEAPLKGRTPYAVSKIISERMLNNLNIQRRIILRPALVFGIGDKGNLIKLIRSIDRNRYVQVGNGSASKSLIYAKDLARAINLCLEKLPPGQHIFNAANPEPVPMSELTKNILKALGRNENIVSVPEPFIRTTIQLTEKIMPKQFHKYLPATIDQIDKLTTNNTYSVSKLVKATGFKPQNSLYAALQAEVDWMRRDLN